MTTTWTKLEHRDPRISEPIFRAGAQIVSRVHVADGVAVLPEAPVGDAVVVEETPDGAAALHAYSFQPREVERPYALFGLRRGAGDEMELWLRDRRGFFYGAPRRAEYRVGILRPGEVVRVLHNAKNDFAAASGRERTYRWNDFVFEPFGEVREVRVGVIAQPWTLPLDRAKTVDLREELL